MAYLKENGHEVIAFPGLLDMDCIPAEQFPAGSLNQREYIKKMADMSEDYLLLAVGKYGFIDELHTKLQEVLINILISLMMVSMTFVMLIIITLSVL